MTAPPPGPTDLTSISLLHRVQAMDDDAWERLVRLYGPLVWSWGRRGQLDPADCADLMQDVFAAVYIAIPSFRRDSAGQTFRGWLRVITRNKIRDVYRNREEQPRAVGGSSALLRLYQVAGDGQGAGILSNESVNPDGSTVDLFGDACPGTDDTDETSTEREQLLRRMLKLIRPDYAEHVWRAFQRTVLDGSAATDVATELEMTPVAVRQAKFRVLRRIRREFRNIEEPDGA